MGGANQAAKAVLGFLTVVEHDQAGMCGGYLLLNELGRPLEFHCTAPVKPNRAQEILYGPTLRPYLYGEHIGRTLADKAKAKVTLLLTDQPLALSLAEQTDVPLALVQSAVEESPETNYRLDAAHSLPPMHDLTWGENLLAVPATSGRDVSSLQAQLAELPSSWDLGEPFDRIREAIREAQKSGR